MSDGSSTILTFTWNNTGFAKGNHTIKAVAEIVPVEIDTADNNFTDGWVIIAMVGDITRAEGYSNGKVDIRDVGAVAVLHDVNYPDPDYNPNCDINSDLKIDIKDIAIVAIHYGEIDP